MKLSSCLCLLFSVLLFDVFSSRVSAQTSAVLDVQRHFFGYRVSLYDQVIEDCSGSAAAEDPVFGNGVGGVGNWVVYPDQLGNSYVQQPMGFTVMDGTQSSGFVSSAIADGMPLLGTTMSFSQAEVSWGGVGVIGTGGVLGGGIGYYDNWAKAISVVETEVVGASTDPDFGTLHGTLQVNFSQTNMTFQCDLFASLDSSYLLMDCELGVIVGSYVVGDVEIPVWEFADFNGGGLTVFPTYETGKGDHHLAAAWFAETFGTGDYESNMPAWVMQGPAPAIAGGWSFMANASYFVGP